MACSQPEVNDYSQHDYLVYKDLSNKQQELEILREIYRAQENLDEDAFKFYLDEYMQVERLSMSPEQKKHPAYKPWLTDEIIKSGEFMKEEYNYE